MADRLILNRGQAPNDGNGAGIYELVGDANSNFAELFNRTDSLQSGKEVPSVSSLLALDDTQRTGVVSVKGFYQDGDGGGGDFYWDPTSGASDDGGTILAVNGVAAGRWKRLRGSVINVRWFGAKGDHITDDFAAISKAVACWCEQYSGEGETLYFPAGWYMVSQSIVVSARNKTVRGDSQLTWIECTASKPAMVLASSYVGAAPIAGFPPTKYECDNIMVEGMGFAAPFDSRASLQVGGLPGAQIVNDTDQEYPVTNVRIQNCWFQVAPLYMFRTWDSCVRSCSFEGQTYFSIQVWSSGRIQFADNTMYASGGGIYVNQLDSLANNKTCYAIVFTHNLITLSWQGIASIQNCTDSVFSDNVGIAMGQHPQQQPEQSGFYIGSATARLQLVNNIIRSTATDNAQARLRYGIEMASASPDSIIAGNDTTDTNFTAGDLSLQSHGLPVIAGGIAIRHPSSNWNWNAYTSPARISLEQPGVNEFLTILQNSGYLGILDQNPTARFSVAGGALQVFDDGTVTAGGQVDPIVQFDRTTTDSQSRMMLFVVGKGLVRVKVDAAVGGKRALYIDA